MSRTRLSWRRAGRELARFFARRVRGLRLAVVADLARFLACLPVALPVVIALAAATGVVLMGVHLDLRLSRSASELDDWMHARLAHEVTRRMAEDRAIHEALNEITIRLEALEDPARPGRGGEEER